MVVLDNASYHKSLAVREWWRAHAAQIQPFFLPAYAPPLKLIERVWRYLTRLPPLVERSRTPARGS